MSCENYRLCHGENDKHPRYLCFRDTGQILNGLEVIGECLFESNQEECEFYDDEDE